MNEDATFNKPPDQDRNLLALEADGGQKSLSSGTDQDQKLLLQVEMYTPLPDLPASPVPTTPSPLKKRKARPLTIALSLFGIFLLIVCGGLSFGYYYYEQNVAKPLDSFIHPVSRGKDELAISNAPLAGTPTIGSYGSVAGKQWNVLLLGSDNDEKYTFPAVLTQVMMVVHIDTVNNTVSMVSIPRDSWVNVPDEGMHKIDQAFLLGASQNDSFDDGVRLARLTVEQDYGIPIDRYAWVGLGGFAKVIDTLGGVDIDVTHPIVDDTYPDDTGRNANNPNAYQRLDIAPGPQHLDGEQALEYVRSRHADLVGDIGRTERQQQVLDALRQKLNVTSVITNFSSLIKDLSGQVYTDFSEQEMLSFANFGRTLNVNDIQRLTLGPGSGSQDYGDYSTVYDSSAGADQDVIIPNCSTIQPVIDQIFDMGTEQSCNVTG